MMYIFELHALCLLRKLYCGAPHEISCSTFLESKHQGPLLKLQWVPCSSFTRVEPSVLTDLLKGLLTHPCKSAVQLCWSYMATEMHLSRWLLTRQLFPSLKYGEILTATVMYDLLCLQMPSWLIDQLLCRPPLKMYLGTSSGGVECNHPELP